MARVTIPFEFPSGQPVPRTRRQVLTLIANVAIGTAVPRSVWSEHRGGQDKVLPSDAQRFLDFVSSGDISGVSSMLDINGTLAVATDVQGRSAYVLAQIAGQSRIADLLALRGIEMDVVEAILAADWDRVKELAAADPTIMNSAHPVGGNPLYASALTGGGEQYRIRALGSDSNGRPEGGTGMTPARAAMDCADPVGAFLAATDILSNGADVNALQANGDSVLHGAVRARDLRLVALAIRKGADVQAIDYKERTALKLAEELDWRQGVEFLQQEKDVFRDYRGSRFAFNSSQEVFALLPLRDIPIEQQNEITGLSHFNPQRVKELLAEKPRLIHAMSTDAELAIEACGHTGHRDVMRIHLDYGAPLSLPTAISLGNIDHARWLLASDPQLVHERGPHDFPVMWYPAISGSLEAAELLLGHGAPIEQESGGETALHWAASRNRTDLIHFLIENDANPAALGYRNDRDGITPLQLAKAKGNEEAVRAFRDAGVRV